jgi:hypothetical protein
MQRISVPLVALAIGVAVTGGCRHGERDTIPAQPFRDESEPDDGFQYYEGAVPAAGEGEKGSGSAATGDTTVEVEIDEGSEDSAESAKAGKPSEDEADADEDEGDEGDGEDGGGGGDDGEDDEEDADEMPTDDGAPTD